MPTNLALLLALLDLAPQLEQALEAEWPDVRTDLLALAGRADEEAATASFGRRLDDLIQRLLKRVPPDTAASIRDAIRRTRPATAPLVNTRSAGGPTQPGTDERPDSNGVVVVPVFFGTDRAPADGKPGEYTGSPGELGFGQAEVSVPTDPSVRAIGELSGPRWWRLEFRPDPAKHVVVLQVQPLPREAFTQQLRQSLSEADARDVLLFVHGYNVAFNDALRRAGQLAVDLKFPGRTLAYSWSSAGEPHKYTVDERTVEWSTPRFEAFLRLALGDVGARFVHVIAHSMGNRALVRALERFDMAALPAGAAQLRQIVFAAPDVDGATFRDIAAALKGRAERFTLYASSRDVALKASKLVHGFPRAGDAGDALVVVDGVDTVDASGVDTSLIGLRHSYFGSKRSILNDIFWLIVHNHAPKDRFDLTPASSPSGPYWQYRR